MSKNDGLIHIHGQDATKFLQGQLTCDVEKIQDDAWQLGAHCNPKGRIISLFRIGRINLDYYLILPHEMIETAIQALQKYAVFFKVKVERCEQTDAIEITIVDAANHKLEQLKKGIADIYRMTSGIYLPHELNLPQLGGVSFNKGCYTGQEIIARMEHLGKLKKHLEPITLQQTDILPGQDYYVDDRLIGNIVDCCKSGYNEMMALILK